MTKVQVRPNAGLSDVQKQWQLVDVYYELKEVLKGQPTEIGPISTHNAYFGGCGVPVVAGVDYLFFVEPFEADATIELKGNSSGFISNTSTQSLPASEVHAENIVSEARDMISRF
ncbi:hypothetical protein OOZ53_15185 [Hoeflea sp. E7-10]|uniref:Uncharacterized protein n=1 Tax=Hoeflea poritis TaxID=2993659 RepID=A0ABT4VPT1_9HYPH|nr:hypothetical protein [Hoeflea poritis]